MVSFILAVGHWTESPWRAMDEYDVFMDASNRRDSTELLLRSALDNQEMQLILLTPQVGGVWGLLGQHACTAVPGWD